MGELYQFSNLAATNSRLNMLQADFSGMKNLEKRINHMLSRLTLSDRAQYGVQMMREGNWSRNDFDAYFSEMVRKELGRQLAIVRRKAVAKAQAAGAGSASSAVTRKMYKDTYAGNINIGSHRGRISSRKRVIPEPDGGKSGIRRTRIVSERTRKLREYYGPDRDFILRFLEWGTDTRTAGNRVGAGGRGSRSTHGNRGAMDARHFFHQISSDMEQAAEQMGQTLQGWVEKFVEKQYQEL